MGKAEALSHMLNAQKSGFDMINQVKASQLVQRATEKLNSYLEQISVKSDMERGVRGIIPKNLGIQDRPDNLSTDDGPTSFKDYKDRMLKLFIGGTEQSIPDNKNQKEDPEGDYSADNPKIGKDKKQNNIETNGVNAVIKGQLDSYTEEDHTTGKKYPGMNYELSRSQDTKDLPIAYEDMLDDTKGFKINEKLASGFQDLDYAVSLNPLLATLADNMKKKVSQTLEYLNTDNITKYIGSNRDLEGMYAQTPNKITELIFGEANSSKVSEGITSGEEGSYTKKRIAGRQKPTDSGPEVWKLLRDNKEVTQVGAFDKSGNDVLIGHWGMTKDGKHGLQGLSDLRKYTKDGIDYYTNGIIWVYKDRNGGTKQSPDAPFPYSKVKDIPNELVKVDDVNAIFGFGDSQMWMPSMSANEAKHYIVNGLKYLTLDTRYVLSTSKSTTTDNPITDLVKVIRNKIERGVELNGTDIANLKMFYIKHLEKNEKLETAAAAAKASTIEWNKYKDNKEISDIIEQALVIAPYAAGSAESEKRGEK